LTRAENTQVFKSSLFGVVHQKMQA